MTMHSAPAHWGKFAKTQWARQNANALETARLNARGVGSMGTSCAHGFAKCETWHKLISECPAELVSNGLRRRAWCVAREQELAK